MTNAKVAYTHTCNLNTISSSNKFKISFVQENFLDFPVLL